ncbi:MAG TPA: AgmX/PglI C-terminal domain-containing protein [Sandaracinaceae bacterium LLY-WYZ-13_1]|nr:AgmX/PglI C-terminal domain-containing protein [Sandaracinaceae bacterium LLY-WYZ-13_1]
MQAVQNRPAGPKVLRIGLIQGGKIVEERIIRKRETVTVGSSEKNHFVVAGEGLSSRFELFQLVGNDYILNFTDDMRGRVGLAGGVQQLEELRKSGGARKADGYYQVKLGDSSRGKVVIGDTTLLFQFVVPPPVQPRPQLPAAVVGGFIAGIDWLFTAFIMFSFMTHFGFIIYLENADWPVEPQVVTVPDRVAELIFNEPPPPQEPQEVDSEEVEEVEEAEEVEVAETTTPTREPTESSPSSESTSSSEQSAADADARLAVEEAQAQVEQMLLGALGGEDGAFQDVLAGGAVTGNAADVMAQAEGVGVATSAEGGALRERGGGGRVGSRTSGLGGLQARTGGGAGRQQQEGEVVVERRIRGSVQQGALAEESGAGVFDPQIVVRQIRARLRSIQTCYERELRNNPTLAGRVMVRFTIQPTGTVSGAQATENSTGSSAVASCVVRTIRRFRFNPGPEGGSVSFAYPFVFAPQN